MGRLLKFNTENEDHRHDLIESSFRRARGAGDDFSLKFMVDNSRYLRKTSATKPFKIIISSRTGYFLALSVAKEVKPGFVTTFSVQPIEVVGTKGKSFIMSTEFDKNF